MRFTVSAVSFLGVLTLVTQLRYFSKPVHLLAIKKGVLLWLLFTSPVILTLLLSPISGNEQETSSVASEFQSILNRDGIFVYSVSLLAPFILIGIGRFINAYSQRPLDVDRSTTKLEFDSVFDGYWLQFWVALGLLALSVFAFAFNLLDSAPFEGTRLQRIVEFCPLGVYLFALILWYLSLLDENNGASNIVASSRENEEKSVADFGARVNTTA